MITVDYDDNDDDDDGDDNDNDGEDDDDDDNDDDDGMFGWHWRAGVNATEDCRRFSTNPFLASTPLCSIIIVIIITIITIILLVASISGGTSVKSILPSPYSIFVNREIE